MKIFPGFDSIYLLGDPLANQPFRGTIEVSVNEATALLRGEWIPKRPVIVRHQMGGAPRKVIWTSFADVLIVDQEVVQLFRANGFKGWTTYPVEVHGKTDEVIEGYQGLAITGRCGHIDDSKSKTVMINYPAGKFPKLRGLYFDPETWDGSDLFMSSEKSRWIFVLESIKVALQKAKLRNTSFRKLTEVERHEG